jgi:hypothetical protein
MTTWKVFFALVVASLLSGCCDLFGICTSASIHTSITGQHQYARQEVPPGARMACRQ